MLKWKGFKWDGSELTDLFDNNFIIEEGLFEKCIYWRIIKDDYDEYCILRLSNSTLPCLIDELKPVFKLQKIGTHWLKYKGKKGILLKIVHKNGIVYQDLTLDKFGYNEYLESEVQKIFVFRELLGLTRNFESSIVLRKVGKFVKPISFYEPNMRPSNESSVIPNTILQKWFTESNLDQSVKKFFAVKTLEDITNLSHELRNKMEDVVNRVNKEEVTSIGEILTRVISRLQYILD